MQRMWFSKFKERYLLDATFRYDGSSRFPKDKRYAFFPSVAIGWRISEEAFMKDNFEWINNLKLKASYGKLGNQEIGNYPYQSAYNLGYNYSFGGSMSQGVAITTAVDPTLHWEETKTTDFGIEGNLWNGLLNFDVTYFYRKTTGILFSPSASVSSIFGYNLSQMNMGELENKGWEFTLGHQHAIGDFKYNISANFSIIKNKVLTLGLADVEQNNGLITSGTLSASRTGATANYWSFSYKKIARCNKFLEEWEKYPGEKTATMARFRAEARFMRATQYFYLASYFHNVPLVTQSLSMDEANSVKKSSRSEIAKWVCTEMQEAAQDLPTWTEVAAESNYGRVCKQAALAFKGRTELMMGQWSRLL